MPLVVEICPVCGVFNSCQSLGIALLLPAVCSVSGSSSLSITMYEDVEDALKSIGANPDFIFVAGMAAEELPEHLHQEFTQYAKSLYIMRGNSEFVKKLKTATFSRVHISLFPRKMGEAGIEPKKIDLFLLWVKDMFDKLDPSNDE